MEMPNNMLLDEFKHQVKLWMELDNHVKRLTHMAKEKRTMQRELTDKILAFMARYNIEDLNTRDGKLRYKMVKVRPSVRQQTIKDRLANYFHDDPDLAQNVLKNVFDVSKEPSVEKPALRRLKSVNVVNV